MLQIIGIAFATLICFIFLRDKAPQFAFIISIIGTCIILGFAIAELKYVVDDINSIISDLPNSISYVKLMIKALLIIILTQITSNICRDNGEGSLASIIETSAKICVISMTLPLFKTILSIILGLVK